MGLVLSATEQQGELMRFLSQLLPATAPLQKKHHRIKYKLNSIKVKPKEGEKEATKIKF